MGRSRPLARDNILSSRGSKRSGEEELGLLATILTRPRCHRRRRWYHFAGHLLDTCVGPNHSIRQSSPFLILGLSFVRMQQVFSGRGVIPRYDNERRQQKKTKNNRTYRLLSTLFIGASINGALLDEHCFNMQGLVLSYQASQ